VAGGSNIYRHLTLGCGVMVRARRTVTKSPVSYPLSALRVTRLLPGMSSAMAKAASRSAAPVAWVRWHPPPGRSCSPSGYAP
jgi:hypothetical protein